MIVMIEFLVGFEVVIRGFDGQVSLYIMYLLL